MFLLIKVEESRQMFLPGRIHDLPAPCPVPDQRQSFQEWRMELNKNFIMYVGDEVIIFEIYRWSELNFFSFVLVTVFFSKKGKIRLKWAQLL